jgi:hypothetical protein
MCLVPVVALFNLDLSKKFLFTFLANVLCAIANIFFFRLSGHFWSSSRRFGFTNPIGLGEQLMRLCIHRGR